MRGLYICSYPRKGGNDSVRFHFIWVHSEGLGREGAPTFKMLLWVVSVSLILYDTHIPSMENRIMKIIQNRTCTYFMMGRVVYLNVNNFPVFYSPLCYFIVYCTADSQLQSRVVSAMNSCLTSGFHIPSQNHQVPSHGMWN